MSRSSFLSCTLALGLAACSPEIADGPAGIGDEDAAVSGDAGGAGDDGGSSGLDPSPRGYAVHSTDYAVTSIGLLKPDGTLLKKKLIDSGSASTGLVTALSGDVVIPDHTGEHGVLVLLDRYHTDVVTRVELSSGKVLGQVKTNTPDANATDAYSSNPHDYVYVDATTAWVTRYQPNPQAGAGDPDRGADLFRIDPTQFERSGERIDFSRWNGQGQRKNPSTGKLESVTTYARPSGMVRLDASHVVVGVDVLSFAFDALGAGLVALVDLETKKIHMLELPGLQSCGSVTTVPDEATRIIVGCTGFYRGVERATAGIAILVREDGELKIERVWRAKDDPTSALTMYGVRALSATEAIGVAAGDAEQREGGKVVVPESHDRLFRIDLRSGKQTLVYEAAGRFVLGGAAFDPRTGLLLVPDASTDDQGRPTGGVHRFQRNDDGSFEEVGLTEVDGILPVRSLSPFE